MNPKWSLLGYSSIALLLLMQTSAAAQVSVGPLTAEGTVEAGAIPQPVPNTDVAKYQEYRDLAQQFIVPQIRQLRLFGGRDVPWVPLYIGSGRVHTSP